MTGPEDIDQPKLTEVLQGDWQSATSGLIFTNRIETCLAVSIYSPGAKKAFLGHFPEISSTYQEGDMAQMINYATLEIARFGDAQLWLGGGLFIDSDLPEQRGQFSSADVEVANETTLQFRKAAHKLMLHTLGRIGLKYQTSFLNKPGELDYAIEVATGEETVHVNPRSY